MKKEVLSEEIFEFLKEDFNESYEDYLIESEHEAMTDDFMQCCGYSEADATEAASCVMEFEGIVNY